MATSDLGYFERHPVRVVSSLNALGLALWNTVRYPEKVEKVRSRDQASPRDSDEFGQVEIDATVKEQLVESGAKGTL